MTSRIAQWTIDAHDVDRIAQWWAEALGYAGNESCPLENPQR